MAASVKGKRLLTSRKLGNDYFSEETKYQGKFLLVCPDGVAGSIPAHTGLKFFAPANSFTASSCESSGTPDSYAGGNGIAVIAAVERPKPKAHTAGVTAGETAQKGPMFKITGPLMNSQDLAQAKFKRACQTAKWPEFDPELDWTREEWARLETEFRYFEGPVRNPDHFAMIGLIKPGDDLVTWVEYDNGEVFVELFDDDDIRDGQDFLRIPEPVVQRKAETRTGPNKPCICGSGKKFKRCCGR